MGMRAVVVAVLAAASAGGFLALFQLTPPQEWVGTAEAIDGDSLRIAGTELRLIGVDAPELRQTCTQGGREEPCGRESRQALERWLRSGVVTCTGREQDRFGRPLVICRVRGVEINAAMVREGQALAFGRYQAEEAEARAAFRGLWAGQFERPEVWRARHPRQP